jgi:hypothetical protein
MINMMTIQNIAQRRFSLVSPESVLCIIATFRDIFKIWLPKLDLQEGKRGQGELIPVFQVLIWK